MLFDASPAPPSLAASDVSSSPLALLSELCAESDTACLLFCHPPTWLFFLQEFLQQLPAWTLHPPATSGLFPAEDLAFGPCTLCPAAPHPPFYL